MGKKFYNELNSDISKLIETNEVTVKEIASKLGIPLEALSQWRREFHKERLSGSPENSNSHDEKLSIIKKESV